MGLRESICWAFHANIMGKVYAMDMQGGGGLWIGW
jgi:hypothetical protein